MQLINRELLNNLGLMLLSTLACLLIFEAGCRVMNMEPIPIIPDSLYINDDTLGYKFAPNSAALTKSEDGIEVNVKTNSQGFWETREPPYKQPVMLVLGDSFTYGAYCCELKDTYPKVLERALSAKGKEYTVINAGVPGYTAKNELEMLKKYYDAIRPKVVVMTFYVENDLYDMQNPFRYKVVDEHLVNAENYVGKTRGFVSRLIYDTKNFFFQNSAGYRVVKKFIENRISPKKSEAYGTLSWYRADAKDIYKEEVSAIEKEFLSYRDYCVEKNISCSVYFAPAKLQFVKNNKEIAKQYGITVEMDYLWIQTYFSKFFSENNISYYNPTLEYQRDGNEMSMYLPVNFHWSEKGCNVTGTYLADKLIEEGKV